MYSLSESREGVVPSGKKIKIQNIDIFEVNVKVLHLELYPISEDVVKPYFSASWSTNVDESKGLEIIVDSFAFLRNRQGYTRPLVDNVEGSIFFSTKQGFEAYEIILMGDESLFDTSKQLKAISSPFYFTRLDSDIVNFYLDGSLSANRIAGYISSIYDIPTLLYFYRNTSIHSKDVNLDGLARLLEQKINFLLNLE